LAVPIAGASFPGDTITGSRSTPSSRNRLRHVKMMLSFMPWRRATDATDTSACSAYAMYGHRTLEEAFEEASAAM